MELITTLSWKKMLLAAAIGGVVGLVTATTAKWTPLWIVLAVVLGACFGFFLEGTRQAKHKMVEVKSDMIAREE